MVEAAEAALQFAKGRRRGDLDGDTMLRFALVRAIEVLGEAVVAMRNRLIHAYFDIDRDILWRTVVEELPSLLPKIQRLLSSERSPSGSA